jgi:iron-sulfur cluster assembly 1
MRNSYTFLVAVLFCVLDLTTTAFTTFTSKKMVPFLEMQLLSSPDATMQEIDFEAPEDAVINIKPKAMQRLRELREKEKSDSLVLRMGVRNGGCSGLSYVMDFSNEDEIQEDDVVDEYSKEKLKCVVDAKSMLYLYGLELDYSDELIGGGFKFFNPNAEESCGCGSSFGV